MYPRTDSDGDIDERILVVYGPRGGERLLRRAERLAASGQVELTMVGVAIQDTSPGRCVLGTSEYNLGVREEVAGELRLAASRLGTLPARTRLKVLVEGRDPPLAVWAARQRFTRVLVADRRGPSGRRPRKLAAQLRAATHARVDLIGAAGGGI